MPVFASGRIDWLLFRINMDAPYVRTGGTPTGGLKYTACPAVLCHRFQVVRALGQY